MATIRIPTPLRKLTQGREEVTAEGATIGALIVNLEKQFPGLRERLCDDKGQVRRFVNIFANDEDIRFLQNLDTPVGEKDEISIVPAIAGGALRDLGPCRRQGAREASRQVAGGVRRRRSGS